VEDACPPTRLAAAGVPIMFRIKNENISLYGFVDTIFTALDTFSTLMWKQSVRLLSSFCTLYKENDKQLDTSLF